MLRTIVPFVAVALLVGCQNAPKMEVKGLQAGVSKTEAEATQDYHACVAEADAAANSTASVSTGSLGGTAQADHTRNITWTNCMRSKGFVVEWREGCEPTGTLVTLRDMAC